MGAAQRAGTGTVELLTTPEDYNPEWYQYRVPPCGFLDYPTPQVNQHAIGAPADDIFRRLDKSANVLLQDSEPFISDKVQARHGLSTDVDGVMARFAQVNPAEQSPEEREASRIAARNQVLGILTGNPNFQSLNYDELVASIPSDTDLKASFADSDLARDMFPAGPDSTRSRLGELFSDPKDARVLAYVLSEGDKRAKSEILLSLRGNRSLVVSKLRSTNGPREGATYWSYVEDLFYNDDSLSKLLAGRVAGSVSDTSILFKKPDGKTQVYLPDDLGKAFTQVKDQLLADTQSPELIVKYLRFYHLIAALKAETGLDWDVNEFNKKLLADITAVGTKVPAALGSFVKGYLEKLSDPNLEPKINDPLRHGAIAAADCYLFQYLQTLDAADPTLPILATIAADIFNNRSPAQIALVESLFNGAAGVFRATLAAVDAKLGSNSEQLGDAYDRYQQRVELTPEKLAAELSSEDALIEDGRFDPKSEHGAYNVYQMLMKAQMSREEFKQFEKAFGPGFDQWFADLKRHGGITGSDLAEAFRNGDIREIRAVGLAWSFANPGIQRNPDVTNVDNWGTNIKVPFVVQLLRTLEPDEAATLRSDYAAYALRLSDGYWTLASESAAKFFGGAEKTSWDLRTDCVELFKVMYVDPSNDDPVLAAERSLLTQQLVRLGLGKE